MSLKLQLFQLVGSGRKEAAGGSEKWIVDCRVQQTEIINQKPAAEELLI
jgi:hypothetical protein